MTDTIVPGGQPLLPLMDRDAVSTEEMFGAMLTATERSRALGRLLYGAVVNVHALVDLLLAKGVLSEEEVASGRAGTRQRVEEQFQEHTVGVKLAADQVDKYTIPPEALPDIDCADRIPLCRAACCTMRWAMTEQDIAEGVVQWDLRDPYANRIAEDGWCVHCEPVSKGCTVYEHRPAVCRTYDCRKDERIWADFDQRLINPDLLDEDGRVRKPMTGEQRTEG